MKAPKTWLIEGNSMTVRELLHHPMNKHFLNDGQIRGRLAAGDRTLKDILRPLGWNKETSEEVVVSDGSTASYYELPKDARELQDLISYKDMNGQIAEIFRACYRYGEVGHSPRLRDAKKIKFYIDAEIKRLEAYETTKG